MTRVILFLFAKTELLGVSLGLAALTSLVLAGLVALTSALALAVLASTVLAVQLVQEILAAVALAAAAELTEQLVNEVCNGTGAGYGSQGNGYDLAVIGLLFLFKYLL